MENLKEQLWPIVKEYTRQVMDVMQCSEANWIGTDNKGNGTIGLLELNGYYYFTFEEVQVIVDHLDEWIERYTSKAGVAEEIADWQSWSIEDASDTLDSTDHRVLDVWENRRERLLYTRPRISLEAWLRGCSREKLKPKSRERLRVLKVKREMLMELGQEYRQSRSLWNVVDSLTADINALEAKVKQEDMKAGKPEAQS